MTSIAGHILLALLLVAAGDILRRAASVQDQLASAEASLATLLPDDAEAKYARVEEALALASRVPVLGEALLEDVRRERTLVAYWRGDYAAIPADEAELSSPGVSDDVVFLAANAAFRGAIGRGDPPIGVQDLDRILRLYVALMKQSPEHVDAAWNYEYVVRLRDRLAKAGSDRSKMSMAQADLPPPPAVHGEQGAPPPETPAEQFNIIVPLRPDERGEVTKAGAGGTPQRKG
ncbi:MAG: hypothetical protein FJW23_13145 [Acidimicrobiia bacterium]|nr:hypothetical protein [Acidimicrobiia bacterium]